MNSISLRPALAGIALASLFAVSAPAAAHDWKGMGYGHPACPGYGSGPHGPGGYACPHGHAKPYHGAAMAPGRMLGVMVAALPNASLDELGLGYGVRVAGVRPGSAAEAAGIQADDLILEVDGKPVYSGDRLRWLVRQGEEGKAVAIKLQRNQEVMTLSATPASPVPRPRCEPAPAPSSST